MEMYDHEVFVFGSNLAGIHGAGSAKEAVINWGAQNGKGVGPQGDAYAIPTKDHNFNVLPLVEIHNYVNQFLNYATQMKHLQFNVVAIGCGLAGLQPSQIASMFKDAPRNVFLPDSFKAILSEQRIKEALGLAVQYKNIDGAHHKEWLIDQMVMVLAGNDYNRIVRQACNGYGGPDTYEWDKGIAP